MQENEAGWDRGLRVVVGPGLLSMTLVGPKTPWGLAGLPPLTTGLWGFGLLDRLLGVSTCPVTS